MLPMEQCLDYTGFLLLHTKPGGAMIVIMTAILISSDSARLLSVEAGTMQDSAMDTCVLFLAT